LIEQQFSFVVLVTGLKEVAIKDFSLGDALSLVLQNLAVLAGIWLVLGNHYSMNRLMIVAVSTLLFFNSLKVLTWWLRGWLQSRSKST
jgi:hypothetical protein